MLTRVVGDCWHAFHRDVMALGLDVSSLTLAEMVSIVAGAPPTSSVRYWLDGGWTREAHLLANMQEQYAGIGSLQDPYQRPGIERRPVNPMASDDAGFFPAEPMSWEEADRRDKLRYEEPPARTGKTRVRVL